MKNQGLIIVNGFLLFPSASHMANRMKEEFSSRGISIDIKSTEEVFAFLGADSKLYCLDLPYDFVLYLDKDKYIARMLEADGIRLFNSAASIEACDDKMLTYLSLSNSGIAMPQTVSCPLNYSSKINEAAIQKEAGILGFPLVVKRNFGSMGKGVFLAKNEEELKAIEEQLSGEPHLYQHFLSSSSGVDYRVIVIGGKAFAWMKRQSQNGDFRSNIAQGGVGEEVDLPDAFKETAEKAARILGLDYAGVDLLIGYDGSPVLCEVNSNAFLQGIESVTKKNVAGAYAAHIVSEIYGR